ncbi:MAG: type II secretion system protein GspM [Janthinobacterium lividum]
MSGVRAWFDGRSLREKRLLLAMLALAALTLVWAGIVLPVTDGLSSSRQRQQDAVIRLGDTEARVAALESLARARPAALSGGLDGEVRRRADAAGFTLQTLNQIGPGRVQLGIASARGGALMTWVAGLEQAGILVETMRLTDNGDHTLGAQMTLRARSR